MTTPTLRVLIADDEPLARERIKALLRRIPHVEVTDVADGEAAVTAIRNHAPNLVFIDIQMPRMSGLEVLREIGPDNMPITIFVTAYDQYALKAFDLAAIDYLLKPFDDERFESAWQRALRLFEMKQSGDMAVRVRHALQALDMNAPSPATPKPTTEYVERIAVESRGQVRLVLAKNVDYIAASSVYVELHVGEKTYVIRERMQTLEERLDPRYFFRIHRSIIVQLDRIDILIRQAGGDYMLKLKNGVQLTVSRNRIEQLERWMGVPGSPS